MDPSGNPEVPAQWTHEAAHEGVVPLCEDDIRNPQIPWVSAQWTHEAAREGCRSKGQGSIPGNATCLVVTMQPRNDCQCSSAAAFHSSAAILWVSATGHHTKHPFLGMRMPDASQASFFFLPSLSCLFSLLRARILGQACLRALHVFSSLVLLLSPFILWS